MPFDEFSNIIDDYIDILKHRKAQNDQNEEERKRAESDAERERQKYSK